MKKLLLVMFLISFAVLFFSSVEAVPEVPHIINDNRIIAEDIDIYFSTDYIKKGSGWIYPEITYKNLPGGAANVDVAFGVNTNEMRFTKAEYWNPHYDNWDTSHQQNMYNVNIVGTYEGTDLDYGNQYNLHKRIIEHDVTNGTQTDRVTSNVSFDSYITSGNHYTIFWHTKHSGIINWSPIPNERIDIINYNFDGKTKWYDVIDISAVENELYKLRVWAELKHDQGSNRYKYDFATKLSSDTIASAIANNRFKFVDPYGDVTNFNSTWNTTKTSTGSTNDTSIKLPLENGGNYNFQVWWGDGNSDNITAWDQANVTHTYGSSGSYDVVIDGTIHGFRFNNGGDKLKLLDISNWGNLRVGNNNGYFYGCSNFNSTATDTLDLTGTTNLINMFRSAFAFNGNISAWDTSSVTTMASMFRFTSTFNGNISAWDTSSVTNMGNLFESAFAFNGNISAWDTSSVTTMASMFRFTSTFNGNISAWDTSSVTNMAGMFEDNNVFNHSLDNWDVSKVLYFSNTFEDCDGFNQPLNNWNTSSATTMDDVFKDATNFNQNLSNWDVSKVTDMDELFEDSAIDQDFGNWNVSACTDFVQMFNGVTLSTTNYDGLLNGWAALPSLSPNEAFHGGNSKYTPSATSARNDTLIGTHGWTITDGGKYTTTKSLFYNATTNYNHTIDSNGDMVVNRSIITADDINHTMSSTGTSYLVVNSWDNTTTTVMNFTIIGSNINWLNVCNLTSGTTYYLNATNGTIVQSLTANANGTANFTTNIFAKTYLVNKSVSATPSTYKNIGGVYYFWTYENIPELYDGISDNSVLSYDAGSDIYTFHEQFLQNVTTDTFYYNETVHFESLNDGNEANLKWLGEIIFDNATTIGWNTTSNTPAPITDTTRAYMTSQVVGNGNITNSNFSYLGFNAALSRGLDIVTHTNLVLHNNTFYQNFYGVVLTTVENATITNNTAHDGRSGIVIDSATNSTISNNTAYSNDFDGFYFIDAFNNTIDNNTARNNDQDGFMVYDSENNTFKNNTIYSNGWEAFYLSNSSNNTLSNNNVSDAGGAYYDYKIWTDSINTIIIDTVKTGNYYYIDTTSDHIKFQNGVDYNIGVIETTAIQDNPVFGTESVNITVVSGTVGQIDASSLTANTGCQLQYINDTPIETQITDGAGSATFLTDITTSQYQITEVFNTSDPISLSYTTGNFWINYTWSADSIMVIDSYNVSQNSTWFNGSSNNWNNSSVGTHGWSNITIYAYNDTIGLSSSYLNDTTQVPNNEILISNLSDNAYTIGDVAYVYANFTDFDDDTPTFTCSRNDLFSDFNQSTGNGTWLTNPSGIFSIDVGVSDGYGSIDNETIILTVNELPSEEEDGDYTGGTGSGGGTASGSGTSDEPSTNVVCKETGTIRNLKSNFISYYTTNVDCLNVIKVSFKPTQNSPEQPILIEELKQKSRHVSVDAPYIVYSNFNLYVGLFGYDSKTTDEKILFRVSKNWTNENEIDPYSVKLYKFENKWTLLPTRVTHTDTEYIVYESTTGATYGKFAISGKNVSYKDPTVADYVIEKIDEITTKIPTVKIPSFNLTILKDFKLILSSETIHKTVINNIPLFLTIIIVFATVILITYILMFERLLLSAVMATLFILLIQIYKGIPFLNIVNNLNIDAIIGAFILSAVILIFTYLFGKFKK